MNPPTLGHYKVIDAMKAFIRKNKDLKLETMPIVVIVEGKETSKDKAKNPLSGAEREQFMKASSKADGVKFIISGSAFAAFEDVRKAGYEPIAVAAGSDRVHKYIELLDKYFKTRDEQPIKHLMVPGLERDADTDSDDGAPAFDEMISNIKDGEELPLSMISGTLARYIAKQDELKAFAYITGLTGKLPLAEKMMKKIQSAQGD
jgi:hypothetical protein